jgi:hypothetical protein
MKVTELGITKNFNAGQAGKQKSGIQIISFVNVRVSIFAFKIWSTP